MNSELLKLLQMILLDAGATGRITSQTCAKILAVLAEAGMSTAIQFNSLTVYAQAGAIAGRAMRRHDSSLATAQHQWLSRALALEKEPYKSEARSAFNAAYREEARP